MFEYIIQSLATHLTKFAAFICSCTWRVVRRSAIERHENILGYVSRLNKSQDHTQPQRGLDLNVCTVKIQIKVTECAWDTSSTVASYSAAPEHIAITSTRAARNNSGTARPKTSIVIKFTVRARLRR